MRDMPVTYMVVRPALARRPLDAVARLRGAARAAGGARAGGPALARAGLPPRARAARCSRPRASYGIEGIVAKRLDCAYEPGRRSGRLAQGQERLRAGRGDRRLDARRGRRAAPTLGALAVGRACDDGELRYAGKVGHRLHRADAGARSSASWSRCAATTRRSTGRQPPKGTLFVEPRAGGARGVRASGRAADTLRAPVVQGPARRRRPAGLHAREGLSRLRAVTCRCHGTRDLERRDQLRAGQHPGEAVQRGLDARRCASTSSTPRTARASARSGSARRRRGGPLRADRQGLRDRPRPLRDRSRPRSSTSLEPKKTRTIDIEDFVDLDEIDPIYYDHPYYLAPDTGAAKAYRLLLDAMEDAGKVAIARVVIRSKEYLVAIRPRDGVLAMETMLFADEVVPPDDARRACRRRRRSRRASAS